MSEKKNVQKNTKPDVQKTAKPEVAKNKTKVQNVNNKKKKVVKAQSLPKESTPENIVKQLEAKVAVKKKSASGLMDKILFVIIAAQIAALVYLLVK